MLKCCSYALLKNAKHFIMDGVCTLFSTFVVFSHSFSVTDAFSWFLMFIMSIPWILTEFGWQMPRGHPAEPLSFPELTWSRNHCSGEEQWGSWSCQHSGISIANPSKGSRMCRNRNGCRDSPKGLCWVWMLACYDQIWIWAIGVKLAYHHSVFKRRLGSREHTCTGSHCWNIFPLFYLSVFPIM